MAYRIIYRLIYWFEPLPTDPPGSSTCIAAEFNADGDAPGGICHAIGKKRFIDLRAGDEVMLSGQRRRIKEIELHSDAWLSDEQAANRTDRYGYCHKVNEKKRKASPQPHDQPQPNGNERRGD